MTMTMVFSSKILKNLEYLFLIVTFMTIAYIGHFFFSNKKPDYATVPAPVKSSKSVPEQVVNLDLKPYEFYARSIENRDIFTTTSASTSGGDALKPTIPAGQLPPNLKVVGLDLGPKAQVIIEDVNSNQTYFITQAKSEIGISIQSVEKDKISLNYQGQRIEIGLKGNQVYGSKTKP
jgi:hypothetical protein